LRGVFSPGPYSFVGWLVGVAFTVACVGKAGAGLLLRLVDMVLLDEELDGMLKESADRRRE
jgi:hypothetical protein